MAKVVKKGVVRKTTTKKGVTSFAQPAPVPVPPQLPDPTFLAEQAAAQRTLALGGAWDTYSRAQLSNQYGYGDVSNPFNLAQLQKEEYQRTQNRTLNSLASQGQLYSGALGAERNYNAKNYAISEDRLRRQYQGAQDAITKAALDRYSTTLGNVSQQDLQSVLNQLGAYK